MGTIKKCVAYWNCAGGIKSKFDYIKDFLKTNKISIFFISEAEINKTLDTDILKIPNYDLLMSETNKSRLACYINSSIKYSRLKTDKDIDLIALDAGDARFIGLYKGFKLPPGKTRVSFFHTIIKTLSRLTKTEKTLVIGGDFNVDLNKESSNKFILENWAIKSGLQQIVETYTRRRVVTGQDQQIRIEQSLIDHVYTNDPDSKVIHVNSVSDHDIIIVTRRIEHSERDKFTVRDWRKYTTERVQQELEKITSQISGTLTFEQINVLLLGILNKLAPKRVVRVKEKELISPKLEALKKKRDRSFKLFKKTKDHFYLAKSKELSNKIKETIKKEAVRIFQCKAKSPDPKQFWGAVNHSLGRFSSPLQELIDEGISVSDSQELANIFANFFSEKVAALSHEKTMKITLEKPTNPITFTAEEVDKVIKQIKQKRSHGMDGICQNIMKDGYSCIKISILNTINDFAANGLPLALKSARVIPLLKKGDKFNKTNYRPISNVSVFSKIFEKCILQRMEDEFREADGMHQHGFKKKHSTETALLTMQSRIAGILESKRPGLVYSMDLSAAFDLLRPDKFYNLFKNDISPELLFSIMDFLQDRTFQVEVNGVLSSIKSLDRGCVQGSVLGPRLFAIYVGKLEKVLKEVDNDVEVISYADDSYVIINGMDSNEVVEKAEKLLLRHTAFLHDLGMVVNKDKTEVMWIGKNKDNITELVVDGTKCTLVNQIKALGIIVDSQLSWDKQAESAIDKGNKLLSMFRFLRKYMTEEQFLKSVTANYYSTVFYSSSVWQSNIKAVYKTKLTSLHFRLLRTACRDYHQQIPRDQLTQRCKRATPNEWAKFTTASIAIKTVRDQSPKVLHEILIRTYYEERRYKGRGLFFDESKMLAGRQSLQNRLQHISSITSAWNELGKQISNDRIRTLLKGTFFSYTTIGVGNEVTLEKTKVVDHSLL